ncbi:hypothetical protein PpBr36_03940 [Pyricularia pennisetigena]|uniref:hypothetical protein n=1 Tax=Pyricularia pennisetigena TaxID=1578925 RepID=UPI0011518151|nr:hypothetical protein PpBr36_03940 [Pyricularia pennisetigena]TLS29946.1 hypothetical protein PpBr36_03940 [Pyricularia pennisetigena]
MQIPTVWTIVTSVAHVQVRQVQDCQSIVSSIEAQLPPMPTGISSLMEAAKTDACTMTAAISYESEIEQYQTQLEKWLMTESNASLMIGINACADYMESTYSALYGSMTTCAPPKDLERPKTSSAGPTNSASTTSSAPTTFATTGATASAAGAASSSVPAAGAGAKSTTSMVVAVGAVLAGSFLLL